MLCLDRFHPSVELCDLAGIAPVDTRLEFVTDRYVSKAIDLNKQHILDVYRISYLLPTKTSKKNTKPTRW